MVNFTPEMMEKARQAKTVEELIALAEQSGMALSAQDAQGYFAQLNPQVGELDDDELDNVSGGCSSGGGESAPVVYDPIPPYATMVRFHCPSCGPNSQGYINRSEDPNWGVSCAEVRECGGYLYGSGGKAEFWGKVSRW